MYKIEELRSKSREELLQLISELKGKLLALRFESATGQLNESHLPSATKKDIARIFTVLKEKELGIEIKETKPNQTKQASSTNAEQKITNSNAEVIIESNDEAKPASEDKGANE